MPIVWKTATRRDPDTYRPPSLASEVVRETFAENYESMPLLPGGALDRHAQLTEALGGQPVRGRVRRQVTKLTAEQAMAQVEAAGLTGELSFKEATTKEAVDLYIDWKRKELYRRDIRDRSPGGAGLTAMQFGAAALPQLADPIGMASNFVPVVSQAKYARWLAGAPNALSRAGVRAGVGAAEGAVGAAILEPVIYSAKQAEKADYDSQDSLINIVFGGALGSGLHTVGGMSADAYRAVRGLPQPWRETPIASAITAATAAREAAPTLTPELIDKGGTRLDAAIDGALGKAAEPATRMAPQVVHVAEELGEHAFTIADNGKEVGRLIAQENGPYLQVKRSDVVEAARGHGLGQELVIANAREAESRGLTAASDVSVSPDQVRVYEAIERRGVPVERNPNAVINKDTGNLISDDPRKPVFIVGKLPERIADRKPMNAAEHVRAAGEAVRESALRAATTQDNAGVEINVADHFPEADAKTAAPDPETTPQASAEADAVLNEAGDDTLEALEEAAALEEQLTAQQAKLMGIDGKDPTTVATENTVQRLEMYAQAAEMAQACLVRGG